MSKQKALDTIKHADKVLSVMQPGQAYFVDEIRRSSGLDPKTTMDVIRRLVKNSYIVQDSSGRWMTL